MIESLNRLRRWTRRHTGMCILIALAGCGLAGGGGVLRWRAQQLPAAERALIEGRFGEARDHLLRCLSWSPGDPDVLCLAARLERVEGNLDAAAAYLGQCEARQGTNALCALESCLLRAQRGDLSEEELLVQLLDANNPQTPWILEALARAHMDAFHFHLALRLFDGWLKIQPDCVRALEWRGRTLERLALISRAVKSYERALQLDPGRSSVRLRLVGILLEGERLAEASPHLDVLERDHPDHPDSCVLLGQRDVFNNRPERARERFQAALRADPNHVRAMLQLGKLELQQDRPKEAEVWLSRAHQAFPFDKHIHFALAECYARLGDTSGKAEFHRRRHDEIKEHSRQIDEILLNKLPAAPKNAQFFTNLASHFFGVGQDRVGLQFLGRALRVDGNYRPAHAALADYYARAGAEEKAAYHRARAGPAPAAPGGASAVRRTPPPGER